MCNCIKDIEKHLQEKGDFKGKKIISVKSQNWALMFNKPSRVFLEFEIEVEGMKKRQKQNVLATYCPFCAEPYDKEEVNAETNE